MTSSIVKVNAAKNIANGSIRITNGICWEFVDISNSTPKA
jgi:hypothetical protein